MIQTLAFHIFAPVTYSDNWVEQLLGLVVKPIHTVLGEHLKWMWVTRYGEAVESTLLATTTEDNPEKTIPQSFIADGMTRRIIFRTSCDDIVMANVVDCVMKLTQANGLHTRITPYDMVQDLGSDRFAPPNSDAETRARRAELVMRFVDASVKLMLDALVETDGQYHLQTWEHRENLTGSFFDSVHHLFCNLTDLDIPVWVKIDPPQNGGDETITLRTPYSYKFPVVPTITFRNKYSWVGLKS